MDAFATMPRETQRLLRIAERDPGRAVTIARHYLNQTPGSAWRSYTLGHALLIWERLDDAETQLTEAAARFATQSEPLAKLYCAYNQLLIAFHRAQYSTLDRQFEAIARQFTQLGDDPAAFRAYLQQVLLYDTLGDNTSAANLLAQLATELPQVLTLDHARWLAADGAVAISRGDFTTAEVQLAAALTLFSQQHASIEQAKCQFQQAWLKLKQEQLEEAEALYRHVEQVFVRLDLPIRHALAARGLGLVLMRRGRYDAALHYTLQAQRDFTLLGRNSDVGQSLMNLGNIYYYAGEWAVAVAHYERAEQLIHTMHWQLEARRNYGMALHRNGKLKPALALLRTVRRQAEANERPFLATQTLGNIANVLGDMGAYNRAQIYYTHARTYFQAHGRDFEAADSAIDQGWMRLKQGNIVGAAELFAFATPRVSAHPGPRWRVQHGLARCAEARGDLGTALRFYRNASRTVADLRGTLAREATSSTLFLQATQLHTDALRCAAAAGEIEDLITFDEWQRALVLQQALHNSPVRTTSEYRAFLQGQQQQLTALYEDELLDDAVREQRIRGALDIYRDLLLKARYESNVSNIEQPPPPKARFSVDRLRAQLNKTYSNDWTVLFYMRSASTLLIIIMTPDDLILHQTPYDGLLQRMIERVTQSQYQFYIFRDAPFRNKQTKRRWDLLHNLADRLLPSQVRERLHPTHRLLIVPTEQLHTVPWAGLRLNTHWLAEQAIVQLTPSLTVWQAQAKRNSRYNHKGHALLLGCSQFGTRADPLPGVNTELNLAAAAWPGTYTRLQDDQATCEALRACSANGELARAQLFHIATHAILTPQQGISAHLKLCDADMWLDEIAELQLNRALVVLSACDGAGADTLPGNEVLSLSWAFLAAGARAVLASLWPLGDQATPPFMQHFYAALAHTHDAAHALAHTQRTLIANYLETSDPLAEPAMWASFVLTGV